MIRAAVEAGPSGIANGRSTAIRGDAFRLWAVLYLLAPTLLFWCCYADPRLGWPIALALGAAASWTVRWSPRDDAWPWVVAFAAAVLLLRVVGFPEGPFNWDWFKHWALLNTLATADWPVRVTLAGEEWSLRFYIAAYLVPAFLHKVVPALPLWLGTALWLGLGVALVLRAAVAPGAARAPLRVAAAIATLLLLGGADFFAENALRLARGTEIRDLVGVHYEWWFQDMAGMALQYPSIVAALFWVPHQSIATFLVAAILADDSGRRSPALAILAYGLLALWSPYGMIGLLPLAGWTLLAAPRDWQGEWRAWGVIAAAAASGLTIAWYLSTDLPGGGVGEFDLRERLLDVGRIVPFLIVELAPFVLVLRARLYTDPTLRICAATLLVLPLAGGGAPDFVMRAALGPLFVLAVRATRVIVERPPSRPGTAAAVVLALVLSAPTAVSEMAYQLEAGRAHRNMQADDGLRKRWMLTFAPSHRIDLDEYFETCGWQYLGQYFSRTQSAVLGDRRAAGTAGP